jgi:hypothetical protein
VFTGRLFDRQKLEQRAAWKKTRSSMAFDRVYGGSALKILQFYAREGEVAPAQKTLLCYGVLNATAVRMDPTVDGLRPALNHCIEIAPAKTTTYTLTAEGAAGATISQSVTVRVNRQ